MNIKQIRAMLLGGDHLAAYSWSRTLLYVKEECLSNVIVRTSESSRLRERDRKKDSGKDIEK